MKIAYPYGVLNLNVMSDSDMVSCMTTRTEHAIRELHAAIGEADHLDDLPSDEANTYDARRMRHRSGMAIKAAEVHALLAIAENLEYLADATVSGERDAADLVGSGELSGVRLKVYAMPGLDARAISDAVKQLLPLTPIEGRK